MSRNLLVKCLSLAALLVVLGFYTAGVLAQGFGQRGTQRGMQRGAQRGERIVICHHTGSGNYQTLVVPSVALSGHFDAQGNPLHQGDYISTDGTCGTVGPTPTPSGSPGGDPDPVPEPITVLLFGAGIAGVGYVARKARGKRSKEVE
ncbi:MAG TPA: PEP-CTERM sorting domain-containing protein [Pyrinomonadaceae bacterium]|nr:PEP-CTERM sorting domain-containing protein [Pyrinomonadaceae bacterium]